MGKRTIIFRGKRVDNGEWLYGYYMYNDKHLIVDTTKGSLGFGKEVVFETVGQFTGLTDKNGKKIFEGDILQGAWGTRIIVFFDNDYLQFRAREISSYAVEHSIDYYNNNKLEIVGNVFDNSQLLRK